MFISTFRIEAAALNEKERILFTSFATTIVKDLIPFIDRCLAAIFPPSSITIIAGSSQVNNESKSLRLDIQDIASPLLFMVPRDTLVEEQHEEKVQSPKLQVKDNQMDNKSDLKIDDSLDRSTKEQPLLNKNVKSSLNENENIVSDIKSD